MLLWVGATSAQEPQGMDATQLPATRPAYAERPVPPGAAGFAATDFDAALRMPDFPRFSDGKGAWSLPSAFDMSWLRLEAKPFKREKFATQLRVRERISESLPVERPKKRRDIQIEFKVWSGRGIGNTPGNWSPYPDRALDARTIHYPLPRK